MLASFLWVSVPDERAPDRRRGRHPRSPRDSRRAGEADARRPKARRLTEVFAQDSAAPASRPSRAQPTPIAPHLNESVVATFQDHFMDPGGQHRGPFHDDPLRRQPDGGPAAGAVDVGDRVANGRCRQQPPARGPLSHPGMIAGMGDRGDRVLRQPRKVSDGAAAVPQSRRGSRRASGANRDASTPTRAGLNEHERAGDPHDAPPGWSCHTQFEPLAFGFARFDGADATSATRTRPASPCRSTARVPTGEAPGRRTRTWPATCRSLATQPRRPELHDRALHRLRDRAGQRAS